YDPVDIGFLQDDEDPMVAWVARATTERGEYELDDEADDPEDPPRPNTFLARAIEVAEEEEGGDGDVGGGRQPHSSQFQAEEEDEVDLLGDLRMERAEGGANIDDDVQFERLMLGPLTVYERSTCNCFLTTKKEGVTYAICCSIPSCKRKGGGNIPTDERKGEGHRSSKLPSQRHCHTRDNRPSTKEEELVLLGIQEREKKWLPLGFQKPCEGYLCSAAKPPTFFVAGLPADSRRSPPTDQSPPQAAEHYHPLLFLVFPCSAVGRSSGGKGGFNPDKELFYLDTFALGLLGQISGTKQSSGRRRGRGRGKRRGRGRGRALLPGSPPTAAAAIDRAADVDADAGRGRGRGGEVMEMGEGTVVMMEMGEGAGVRVDREGAAVVGYIS
ncbi:hypothetical protein Taro_023265, partial [Colocasia esculenta]|nr:hypothetical protein [Colocasia esculenta]